MFDVDWEALWVPSGSLAEIAIRGAVVYLALFVAMRLLPRREVGGVGPADILVVVIIADAVQQAMAGGYRSITEGLLLAAVIFAWATLIDAIDYRFPQLHLAAARPKLVVSKGRFIHRNCAATGSRKTRSWSSCANTASRRWLTSRPPMSRATGISVS